MTTFQGLHSHATIETSHQVVIGRACTMHESGFLAPWLRDLGAAIGLITGLIGLITGLVAIFKAFFEGRPSSYLEPDELNWTLKMYVQNTGKGSIVINRFRILPRNRWYVAPNANLRHTIHSAVKGWHNVIIEPGKKHEFYLGVTDRDAEPACCLALMTWQRLGGLSFPRPPVLLFKNRNQIKRLLSARKGTRDSPAG